MHQKRVFKTKTFDRWAKKLLSDKVLCEAAREIEQGLYEADLGGGVCKKRIAIEGMGKAVEPELSWQNNMLRRFSFYLAEKRTHLALTFSMPPWNPQRFSEQDCKVNQ